MAGIQGVHAKYKEGLKPWAALASIGFWHTNERRTLIIIAVCRWPRVRWNLAETATGIKAVVNIQYVKCVSWTTTFTRLLIAYTVFEHIESTTDKSHYMHIYIHPVYIYSSFSFSFCLYYIYMVYVHCMRGVCDKCLMWMYVLYLPQTPSLCHSNVAHNSSDYDVGNEDDEEGDVCKCAERWELSGWFVGVFGWAHDQQISRQRVRSHVYGLVLVLWFASRCECCWCGFFVVKHIDYRDSCRDCFTICSSNTQLLL